MAYARYPAMRNWDKRCELQNKILEMEKLLDNMHMESEEASDKGCELIEAKIDDTYNKLDAIRRCQFSLECPKTKNEWIRKVIAGYKDGTYKLTQKQLLCFARPAEQHPDDHYHRLYFRVNNRLVYFHFNYMTVETLAYTE